MSELLQLLLREHMALENQKLQYEEIRYSLRDQYLSLNMNLLHPVVQHEYMPENLVPFKTPCLCQIVFALGILK